MKKNIAILLLALGAVLSGCAHATSPANAVEHTGTYRLVAIDGHDIPYTPHHAGGAPEVRSSRFNLEPNGTFTMTMTYGSPSGEEMSRDFSGTYTRNELRFEFVWDGAGTTTAVLERQTLTMDNHGTLFAYHKEPPQ